MKLGQNVRELRKAMGYSQRELGERSGVPRQEISRIETGGNYWLHHVKGIAEVLEISLQELEGRGQ